MKRQIKALLKKVPFLLWIKSRVWEMLRLAPMLHASFVDPQYFEKLFSEDKNFRSLTFDEGLTRGEFQGVGYVLEVRPKNLIECHVHVHGLWESHIAKLIAGYLNSPDSVVVDVGANIGATSIPLAKCYPKTTFYLFEPHPLVFDVLRRNLSMNRLKNAQAHQMAITDSTHATLPFYAQRCANNMGLSSFSLNYNIGEHDVIDVPCTPLDAFFQELDEHVSILKIDTQGHEMKVLRSAKKTIAKDRPVIFFEYESEYFPDPVDEARERLEIMNFFRGMNYELFMVHEKHKFMPKVSLENYFQGDIIAVPLPAGGISSA